MTSNHEDAAGTARPSTALRIVLLWGPVAGYCLVIYLLSSASHLPDLPRGVSDKAAHILLYSGLGFLLARAVAGGLGRPVPGWMMLVAVAASMIYGLSDEMHQLFVPRREFDLLDLVADGVGAAAGAAVLWVWGIIATTQREAGPRLPE